jgi:hypothetical protein
MASTDLAAIMRRDERRRQMLADPMLTGDTLMLVLALEEIFAARAAQGFDNLTETWVGEVSQMVRGHRNGRWILRVVAADAPLGDLPAGTEELLAGTGMLPRYFPDFDWVPVYRWAGVEGPIALRRAPATAEPAEAAASVRPTLRLIHGGARTGTRG